MEDILIRANRRRIVSMVVIAVLALAGAALDQVFSATHLRPLATLCVVAFTLFSELPAGIVFAIGISAIYSVADPSSADLPGAANVAVFTAVNVLAAYIANTMALRAAETAGLKASLAGELKVRQQMADIAAARVAVQEIEQRYLSVSEFIPFGTWHTRPDGTLQMSQSFLDLVGMTNEEIQDGGWSRRVEPEDARRFIEAWDRREEGDGKFESEYRIRGVNEKLYTILSRGTRISGANGESLGWVGVSLDITERKLAEERLEFLAEAGRVLALSLDPHTTLGRIAGLCVPTLADWCAVELLQDDGGLDIVALKHRDPSQIDRAREFRERYFPDNDAAVGMVVRTGKSLLLGELTSEPIAGARTDGGERARLRELEPTSVIIAPLIARGNTLGAITLVSAESKRRYGQDDMEFAEIVSRRAALAYDNARLFAREQHVAESLQTASLPTLLPDIPGLRINATYRAGAKELEIGGDWYDAFELPDGDLALSVGDVAGKGLKAAVAMGAVRQAFRAAAFEGASPAEVLNRSNRLLCHQNIGMVTAAIGILNVETRVLTFATAGHPPILNTRQGSEPRRLTTEGLPLGVLPEYVFTQDSTTLEKGSLLVMYTDGLVENTRDVVAGELATAGAVQSESASPSLNSAESIVARVLSSIPTDDVAVLTVHLESESFDRVDLRLPAEPESSRTIRRGLRRLCAAAGLTEQRTLNVLVASGEAVSNAIQHAYGVEGGIVSVVAYRSDGSIVVEVTDAGKWRPEREDGHGRGITLMRKLMDSVSIESKSDGTMVSMSVAIGPAL
ncbi:MAG TPA: SpoIIE family protein phosphatase [Candidatus Eremiobacteraceae bacterium]|nr:SpoIIE family protein phosphatase [Candidatus Eremiobacteraceae bacterium]